MDADRRTLLGAMLASTLLPGCAQASSGVAPAVSAWRDFSGRFMTGDGRIVDTGNGNVSHSEGQGYGMLFAEAAGDRAAFDRLWGWTRKTLARPDAHLFSWRFDPVAGVSDPNNASDGDILIAWALLRAARRWPNPDYAAQSTLIRNAIRDRLIRKIGTRTILLPGLEGFIQPDRLIANPSYYIWPALDAFAAADSRGWSGLLSEGEKLFRDARFGAASLPADWIDVHADGSVTPAAGRPSRFGFDAIRVPLYLLWSRRRGAVLQPFQNFWGDYQRRAQPIPAWIDVLSGATAPYPLSTGGMAVVNVTLGSRPAAPSGDYYSSALGCLAILARG